MIDGQAPGRARTLAIIPARSGSKGVPNKNIRKVAGKHLIGYSIEFAQRLQNIDDVICSTDSEHYAEIARRYGASVPFLRSAEAAGDTTMEQDVIREIHASLRDHDLALPDLIVWLRPTFLFRPVAAVDRCIHRMLTDETLTACRLVVETDPRLYFEQSGFLRPSFDDGGKSMVRRQDVPATYRAYNTDVFRLPLPDAADAFLGDRVGFEVAPKICGLDIDDETDLQIVAALFESARELIEPFLPLPTPKVDHHG